MSGPSSRSEASVAYAPHPIRYPSALYPFGDVCVQQGMSNLWIERTRNHA